MSWSDYVREDVSGQGFNQWLTDLKTFRRPGEVSTVVSVEPASDGAMIRCGCGVVLATDVTVRLPRNDLDVRQLFGFSIDRAPEHEHCRVVGRYGAKPGWVRTSGLHPKSGGAVYVRIHGDGQRGAFSATPGRGLVQLPNATFTGKISTPNDGDARGHFYAEIWCKP